jgi:hypothetical protein
MECFLDFHLMREADGSRSDGGSSLRLPRRRFRVFNKALEVARRLNGPPDG